MLQLLADKRDELQAICRQFGVRRLEVFGSAARGIDFDPAVSDVDLLVELESSRDSLATFLDLKDAFEALLGRSVDLVERQAVEASRNPIRRRLILGEARAVYAA